MLPHPLVLESQFGAFENSMNRKNDSPDHRNKLHIMYYRAIAKMLNYYDRCHTAAVLSISCTVCLTCTNLLAESQLHVQQV